jgi:GMP synthase-like glutamine amidotransferase
VTTLVLIVRLVTTSASVQAGAILGTAASAVILLGGFWSMRDEDGWVPETDRTIERVSL